MIQCHQTGIADQKPLCSCSLKHNTLTAHAQKKKAPKIDFSPFDLVVKEVFRLHLYQYAEDHKQAHAEWVRPFTSCLSLF